MTVVRRGQVLAWLVVASLLGLVPTPAAAADPPRAQPWTPTVARGLGVWVDVFDWTFTHSGDAPSVDPEDLDGLAGRGVRTLYIQTARTSRPDDVLERPRLERFVDRAHANGISVVGWYLPTLVDPDRDLRRFRAALELDIDGFALDIESTEVADPAERNRRLVELSRRMRAIAGDRALIATVLPPVALEDIAPDDYWPDFPWRELGELYDVVQPMAYFSYREPGEVGAQWRDAEAYVAQNVRRVRRNTGDPDTLVHVIGGIADRTTAQDVRDMTAGALASGAMGLSLYDLDTTGEELWAPMHAWRTLHEPGGTRFVDLPVGDVFGPEVEAAAVAGITRGCNPPSNDLFCPHASVTRGQLAAFLVRALGLPAAAERFDDVATDDVFAADIGALAAAGITRGCDPPANRRFCPDEPLTRGQMAAFLVRALGLPAAAERFDDVAADDVFAADIGALAAADITRGCDPPANRRFCPDGEVTREQLAAFLVRAGLAG